MLFRQSCQFNGNFTVMMLAGSRSVQGSLNRPASNAWSSRSKRKQMKQRSDSDKATSSASVVQLASLPMWLAIVAILESWSSCSHCSPVSLLLRVSRYTLIVWTFNPPTAAVAETWPAASAVIHGQTTKSVFQRVVNISQPELSFVSVCVKFCCCCRPHYRNGHGSGCTQ